MHEPQFRIGSSLPAIGCASLILIMFFMCLMPFLLVDLMHTALLRLHLSPTTALLSLVGIFVGSVVNIPVYRLERSEPQVELMYGMFGMVSERFRRMRRETIIAVNLGGCVVPAALAVWQIVHLGAAGGPAWTALLVASAANVAVCYFVARPVSGIGIMMPGFVSPLTAVGLTWLLLDAASPDRAPVAFVSGVLGPLVGADLLHLKDIGRVSSGLLSIGGAGTFDGIVLSGVLASLLA